MFLFWSMKCSFHFRWLLATALTVLHWDGNWWSQSPGIEIAFVSIFLTYLLFHTFLRHSFFKNVLFPLYLLYYNPRDNIDLDIFEVRVKSMDICRSGRRTSKTKSLFWFDFWFHLRHYDVIHLYRTKNITMSWMLMIIRRHCSCMYFTYMIKQWSKPLSKLQ